MRNLCLRQLFCEEVSDAIFKHLQEQFQNEKEIKMCFIQRTMHPAKRKKNGFTLSQTMIALLSKQFSTESSKEFCVKLESALTAVVQESKSWEIEVTSWHKEGDNYEIEVNKTKAFCAVVKSILDFKQEVHAQMTNSSAYNILCHVSTEPTLDDIRSLLYCSLLQRFCSPEGAVILMSNDGTDRQKFYDLLKAAYMDEKCFRFTEVENGDTGFIEYDGAPQSFFDCLSESSKENFPRLSALQRQDNRTAFQSRILCCQKNSLYISTTLSNLKMMESRTLHVCNHRNQVLAQQSELFYAWYYDSVSSHKTPYRGADADCDGYVCHAGVQGCDKLDVAAYLEGRKRLIKESFEAKLQVNLEGDDWEALFCKMRAAVIRLEFFRHSVSSKMKLSVEGDSLPTFATFILYNYSRLCMLLDSHESKVQEGFYPTLCEFEDVDFSSLGEDAEWELLIDHLWNFNDIISKPLVSSQKWKVKVECHQIVHYLHQLCRAISALYSRHHILGENFPHLLPVMNARIYLMKAAKKVMSELFHILGVEPMTQM